MTLTNTITYEPAGIVTDKQGEQKPIALLKDVRDDLDNLNNLSQTHLNRFSLRNVLAFIDVGKYKHSKQSIPGATTVVDLSKAQALIQEYRFRSEKGCQSCEYYSHSTPFPDETYSWCGTGETEKDVDERKGYSPRIGEYFKLGCTDRNPKYKPLEELLTEAE